MSVRALPAAVLVLFAASIARAAAPAVVLVKTSTAAPFEAASTAIADTLRADAAAPVVHVVDLGGERANGPHVIAAIRRARPGVIVTVGSLATDIVLADASPVPVVFATVLYPEESGFVPSARRAVTGAALDPPVAVQFAYLRRLLPQSARVGVLFHRRETGGVVDAAGVEAPRHGFTLAPREVADPHDTLAVFTALVGEVDVVWAVADSFVFAPQTTAPLILAALRHRVPVVGLSAAHVRSGALAALSSDYAATGERAAAMALRVLHGENAASIPVDHPRTVRLAVNLRTAQHLGITIPPDLVAEAIEVVR